VDTDNPALRDYFRDRMAGADDELERMLQTRGIDLVRLRTDASFAEPLMAFFRQRERRKGR
jgi:hypothetical protein